MIQDQSLEPTHVGHVDRFMSDGEKLYRKIRELVPQAKIVLYQTWALEKENAIYSKQSSPKTFADPGEMTAELVKNYAELAKTLEAIEPAEQVLLSPVGVAFARCQELHPEIDLYNKDKKHAGEAGHYLSALVHYATITGDSPIHPSPTPGVKIPEDVATKLQKIAEEVVSTTRRSTK